MQSFDASIVLIPVVAVLAPLAARGLGPWMRVPVVVFELLLGILIGPSVLGLAHATDFVDKLSSFGLAMLFFVAGSEIEFRALRGRAGKRAVGGWLLSLIGGLAAGWLIAPGQTGVVIAVALASTALGTLLPILRDAAELHTPFGRSVGAIGAVGEFGPLVAISIFLGSREPGIATVVLATFVVIAATAIILAIRLPQGALHRVVSSTLHTSGQFAIRVILLILGGLVAISIVLDLDMLLGAFAAGVVWRLMMRDASEADRQAVDSKVEAVAFGFLVPIFFVYTGVTFDLASLIAEPILLAIVPVVLVAFLVIRGIPSMLAAPVGAPLRDRISIMFLGATGLPIIVAVTAIGVQEQILSTQAATVLVAGGMLSVLLFPLIGMAIRGEKTRAGSVPELDDFV